MALDTNQITKRLKKLMQLDVDAVRAYEQALKHIDDPKIHAAIASFRDDHQRHIGDLSGAISSLGEQPPSLSPDVKGVFLEGFTALRSVTGQQGALKAMKGNEKLTNRSYAEALKEALPADIEAVVRRNYEDEQRHLSYIERALGEEPTTEARPHTP